MNLKIGVKLLHSKFRTVLRKFILTVVKLLHQDQRFSLKDIKSIENEVDEMVKFEHALSQKMRSKGSASIQPLTLEKADLVVGTITPTFGPWLNFTRNLISKTGPTIGELKNKYIRGRS